MVRSRRAGALRGAVFSKRRDAGFSLAGSAVGAACARGRGFDWRGYAHAHLPSQHSIFVLAEVDTGLLNLRRHQTYDLARQKENSLGGATGLMVRTGLGLPRGQLGALHVSSP